ncbi:MAG TPA: hypothetical protein VGF67_33390 [Ktedonobacteraceae bacterium]
MGTDALYCSHCSYPVEAETEKEHTREVLRSLYQFRTDEEKLLTVESLLYLSDLTTRRSLYQVKSDDGKGLTLESVFYLSDLAVRDFKTLARTGRKSVLAAEMIRFYEGRQQYIKNFATYQKELEEQYKEAQKRERERAEKLRMQREQTERLIREQEAALQMQREQERRRKRERRRAARAALWQAWVELWKIQGQTAATFFLEPTILTISLGCIVLLALALGLFFQEGKVDQRVALSVIFGAHPVFIVFTFVFQRLSRDIHEQKLRNFYKTATNINAFSALTFLLLGIIKLLHVNDVTTIQWLVPALALYITCAAGLFALTQQFPFFGYIAVVALATAFVTVALPLRIAPFYWPLLIMAMALCSLCSLSRADGNRRSKPIEFLWEGQRKILRNSLYTSMLVTIFVVLLISIVALPTLFSLSVLPMLPGVLRPEADTNFHVALVSMLSLVLLWGILFLRWRGHKRGWLVVALFTLACALLWVKALHWGVPGYLFVLTGVALLYHGASRFLLRGRTEFPRLGLYLDLLALLLGGIAALISNAGAPLQLFGRSLQSTPLSLNALANILALGVSSLLVCSIALGRGSYATPYVRPQKPRAWLWLLLPAGVLFTCDWSQCLLFLPLPPYQGMLALTVLLVAVAAAVRSFSEKPRAPWSNPLDLLALSNAILVCLLALDTGSSLKNNLNIASDLSLFFAILFYSLLLLQQRSGPLFIPFSFALLAAPGMPFFHAELVIGLGLLLPFAAMGVRRLMPLIARPAGSPVPAGPVWEWPLFWLGIIYGLALAIAYTLPHIHALLEGPEHTQLSLVLLSVPHLTLLPDKLALLTLGLGWYVAAVLARTGIPWKWWGSDPLENDGNDKEKKGVQARKASQKESHAENDHSPQIHYRWWMSLAAFFATWQLLIRASDEPYLLIAGLVAGLGGLGAWVRTGRKARAQADLMDTLLLPMKRLIRQKLPLEPDNAASSSFAGLVKDLLKQLDWSWPWYVVMLVAAVLLWRQFLFLPQLSSNLAGYGLLAFAGLIYSIGLAEKQAVIYWGALIFSSTTFLSFTFHYQSPLYRSHLLLTIVATLLCAGVGLAANIFGRVRPDRQTQQRRQWWRYILPFYATALLAGICTGIYGLFDQALLVEILKLLLIWAAVAYGIGLLEERAVGSWLTAFFAVWALIGLMSQPPSGSSATLLVGMAMLSIAVAVGMRARRAYGRPGAWRDTYGAVRYTLPIYLTALLAGVLSGSMVTLLNQRSGGLFALFYCCIAYTVAIFERRAWVLGMALVFGIWAIAAIQDSVTIVGIGLGAGIVSMVLREQLLTRFNIAKGPLR